MHMKTSSAKWWPFCLGLNVINTICPHSNFSNHVMETKAGAIHNNNSITIWSRKQASRALFTKGTDVLPQDLVKSRSHEIHVYFPIALKFHRLLGSKPASQLSERYDHYNIQHPISRRRDFTRPYGAMSVRLVVRGAVGFCRPALIYSYLSGRTLHMIQLWNLDVNMYTVQNDVKLHTGNYQTFGALLCFGHVQ